MILLFKNRGIVMSLLRVERNQFNHHKVRYFKIDEANSPLNESNDVRPRRIRISYDGATALGYFILHFRAVPL